MGHPGTERAPPRAPGVHRCAPGWGPSPPITPCAVHARGARCTLHPAFPLRGGDRALRRGHAPSHDPSPDLSNSTRSAAAERMPSSCGAGQRFSDEVVPVLGHDVCVEVKTRTARGRFTTADGFRYTAGLGYFSDGRLAEIFLNAEKIGTAIETIARDRAVVASIALQHGVPTETIRRAVTRNGNGEASGPLGALLDLQVSRIEP
jgi:hypothetical protein